VTRLTRIAACIIGVGCIAAIAVGCGGDGARPAAAASAGGSTASTSEAPLYTIPGSLLSAASSDPGGETTTTLSWEQEGHVVAMPPDFTVTVDKPCVHAEETQGFTVRGGLPNQLLIYDTFYADGTNDYTSHYGTGSGQAKFDGDGNYRATFVLAGKVPPGTAYLQVASAKGQLVQARTSFLIKPLTEACP